MPLDFKNYALDDVIVNFSARASHLTEAISIGDALPS